MPAPSTPLPPPPRLTAGWPRRRPSRLRQRRGASPPPARPRPSSAPRRGSSWRQPWRSWRARWRAAPTWRGQHPPSLMWLCCPPCWPYTKRCWGRMCSSSTAPSRAGCRPAPRSRSLPPCWVSAGAAQTRLPFLDAVVPAGSCWELGCRVRALGRSGCCAALAMPPACTMHMPLHARAHSGASRPHRLLLPPRLAPATSPADVTRCQSRPGHLTSPRLSPVGAGLYAAATSSPQPLCPFMLTTGCFGAVLHPAEHPRPPPSF